MSSWQYFGLYGDSKWPETVHVQIEPENLSKELKNKLLFLYKDTETKLYTDYSKEWKELRELGLVRETGNAWNKGTIFAPTVHRWMKKPNINEALNRALSSQYTVIKD